MKKFYSLLAAMFVTGMGVANAEDLGPATIAEGPENGGEYLEYQSELVVTWGDETLAFASDDPSFNIYVVEFAYPDDPDSFTLSDCEVVNVGRGIRNGIRFTFNNITSKLDPTNYFGPRLTKYGEFTLTIPEGLVTSNGIPNPTQQISWKQVEELSGTPDDPGNSGEPMSYTIDEVTTTSVTVTFLPSSEVAEYYFFGSSLSIDMNWIFAQMWGGFSSISEMIEVYSYDFGGAHSGEFTYNFTEEIMPGAPYYIGVALKDAAGNYIEPYIEIVADLSSDTPGDPMDYTIDEVTTSSVTVTFLPSSEVAEYYFFGSSLSIDINWMWAQGWFSSISEMIEAYSYDFGGAHSGEVTYNFTEEVVPGQPYYIGVASKDASGNYIEPYIEIVADISTGVNTLENENIYRVYDLQGNKVIEGSDLNGLKKGIYIINGKKVMIK